MVQTKYKRQCQTFLNQCPNQREQEQFKAQGLDWWWILNDPNHESKEKEGMYCDVCNPNGHLCPNVWENRASYLQNEEMGDEEEKEPAESDWDTDLEEHRTIVPEFLS